MTPYIPACNRLASAEILFGERDFTHFHVGALPSVFWVHSLGHIYASHDVSQAAVIVATFVDVCRNVENEEQMREEEWTRRPSFELRRNLALGDVPEHRIDLG